MSAWFVVALLSACRSEPQPVELVPVEVLAGELHVPNRVLDCGTVPLHDTAQQDLVLSNVGAGTLYIHDLQLSDDGLRAHWSILGEVEQEIAPGGTILVTVLFTPAAMLDPGVMLNVLSSDPAAPQTRVELAAEVQGTPVLRLEPDLLAFGAVPVGQSATLDIVIANLGNDTLSLESVTLETLDGFVLTIDPSGSTLAPGESNGLASVTYTPQDSGGHTGLLTFASNDPDRAETAVVLTGLGG